MKFILVFFIVRYLGIQDLCVSLGCVFLCLYRYCCFFQELGLVKMVVISSSSSIFSVEKVFIIKFIFWQEEMRVKDQLDGSSLSLVQSFSQSQFFFVSVLREFGLESKDGKWCFFVLVFYFVVLEQVYILIELVLGIQGFVEFSYEF